MAQERSRAATASTFELLLAWAVRVARRYWKRLLRRARLRTNGDAARHQNGRGRGHRYSFHEALR